MIKSTLPVDQQVINRYDVIAELAPIATGHTNGGPVYWRTVWNCGLHRYMIWLYQHTKVQKRSTSISYISSEGGFDINSRQDQGHICRRTHLRTWRYRTLFSLTFLNALPASLTSKSLDKIFEEIKLTHLEEFRYEIWRPSLRRVSTSLPPLSYFR